MMNRKVSTVVFGLLFPVLLLCGCTFEGRPVGNAATDDDFDPHMEYIREQEYREQVLDRQEEFGKLDTGGDGFLTVEEYNGPPKMFQDLDTDGDEQLSPEEAKQMMTFAEIPSGSFIMGTDEPIQAFFEPAEDGGPAHEVKIDGFQMSATEITNAQYVLYLNSALEAGEIEVKMDTVSGAMTRVFYPVPAYMITGAPGTKYAGLPHSHLSPISPISHNEAPNTEILIPEHPLNQSWINYYPDTEHFYVHPGYEDWPAVHIK